MTERYPQSLLILDNVWEPETAKAFEIRCRTMITSRYANIADEIITTSILKVEVMKVHV